jgi:tRNA-dihydrouridine synthase B
MFETSRNGQEEDLSGTFKNESWLEAYKRNYSIGRVRIRPNLVLAPMSGVTHSPFRRLIKELNPGCVGLVMSEFISIEGLTRGSVRSREMMDFHESERPYGIQIFGFDIDRMRDAALMAQDRGADLIDINCGCPAPKVVKRGGGCELMRHPEHLRQLVKEVRKYVKVPLSVKFRSGWSEDSVNAIEIAKLLESEGVDAITVHGRTRSQLYRGKADWNLLAKIASEVRIPVAGSGDVVDYDSACERWESGVAGMFIGRAALANPLVFREILEGSNESLLRNAAVGSSLMITILNRYIELLLENFEPRGCVGPVKQLASQMCKGLAWSKRLCRVNTLAEQSEILSDKPIPIQKV